MKFGGVWVPVCFAWLPDKNALTYKIGISKNKKVLVQKRIEKKKLRGATNGRELGSVTRVETPASATLLPGPL